ncbi:ABC-type transport auxiliary lipoprotein family protein [Pseudomonas sp. LS44]|uniref:PqiC family protein n=1 Tax=Pseudomonas sp. LS44 TaxID=1357074 RepID=UPI00215A5E9C|nr:ABC-type transport auxiliary lipoprotein family protein [Pseudomonas sp. LS44]UVE17269.1 ABC-type transport auxiliary lipoprotein family protein [Pseudomonas sp. LS44]
MIGLRVPKLILLVGVLGLAACVSHQPLPLYKLDSGAPSVSEHKDGPAVLLGPVEVADYLQRETLLQRQPDGSLTPAPDERWAGSLAADIKQLLLHQLAWRLDTQRLALAPASEGFSADAQVLVSISRLDSGPQQPAVLEAHWRVLDKRGQLRESRMVRLQEAHQGTPADQVRAQSLLLQRMVEELAVAVRPVAREPAPVAETPRKPAAAAAKPKEPEEPKIPMAAPVRTDVEVFRF